MKKNIKYGIASLILLSISIPVCKAQNENPQIQSGFIKSRESVSITIPELKEHVFFLASDSMNGRKTGSVEYLSAAKYCAEHFRKSGIVPIYTGKNGESSFYQDVPYRNINFTKGRFPVISLTEKDEPEYAKGLTFKKSPGAYSENRNAVLPVVFAGYGVSAPEYGWDDFKNLNIAGKVVLVLNQKPPKEWIDKIPSKKRERLMDYRSNISKRKAAAIVEIADAEWMLKTWSYGTGLKSVSFFVNNASRDKKNQITSSSRLYIKTDVVSPLFEGQLFDPTKRITPGQNEYRTFELKGVGLDTADYTNEKQVFSPNVVGIIKGSDSKLANQYIVVGAHLDHVGEGFNGADDNASGSAGVLEIAEALAMNPPKRSVLFVLFSGEENFFLGSIYFVENCPVPVDSIISMINLDMIGRTEEKLKNERTHFICNLMGTSDLMLSYVEEVNAKTYRWPLQRLIHSGSDHASFAPKGIPSVFFYSGQQKDLHTKDDDPENIDYEKMQVLSQLIYEVVRQVANNGIGGNNK